MPQVYYTKQYNYLYNPPPTTGSGRSPNIGGVKQLARAAPGKAARKRNTEAERAQRLKIDTRADKPANMQPV